MSKNPDPVRNRSSWCFILLAAGGSWISGCGTEALDGECPDTSFSKANLDTLEAQNPNFIWRVCNANEEYAMEKVAVPNTKDSVIIGTLESCECSVYFGGEWALGDLECYQGGEEYRFIYLANYRAVRGLADSTSIKDAPGRYSYHFMFEKDTSKPVREWTKLEIEREAYH